MLFELASLHPATLIALLLASVAIYPVLHYLVRGWCIRRDDIFSSLSIDGKRLYLNTYLGIPDVSDPEKQFRAFYYDRYGRRNFIIPLVIMIAALLPLGYVLGETAISQMLVIGPFRTAKIAELPSVLSPFLALPDIASAGIIGAYLWIVAELIAVARQFNLGPPDVQRATLRLIVAAPLGYAIGSLANAGVAPFIAFSVGAFPLEQIGIILRKLANRRLSLDSTAAGEKPQVFKLDGVDDVVAEALRDAGITTVSQLANYDPVQLCMRTGLSFDFVLDLVCQALAWTYFGEKLDPLRPAGLRGAIEIRNLYEARTKSIGDEAVQAGKIATEAAKLVGVDEALFLNACAEVAGDPATEFLSEVWSTGWLPVDEESGPVSANAKIKHRHSKHHKKS